MRRNGEPAHERVELAICLAGLLVGGQGEESPHLRDDVMQGEGSEGTAPASASRKPARASSAASLSGESIAFYTVRWVKRLWPTSQTGSGDSHR